MAFLSNPLRLHNSILARYLVLGLLLVFISSSESVTAEPGEDIIEYKEFYDACARGKLDLVEEYISRNPELVTASTKDGETCLHLTAVSKSLELVELLITKGANTNHRVTHDQGLRMTPLSWHAYGGNVEIIRLLLDNGAEINAEFDYSFENNFKVTATDIAQIISGPSSGTGDDSSNSEATPFRLSYDLLRSRGGKTFEEMFPNSPHILDSGKENLDGNDEL